MALLLSTGLNTVGITFKIDLKMITSANFSRTVKLVFSDKINTTAKLTKNLVLLCCE